LERNPRNAEAARGFVWGWFVQISNSGFEHGRRDQAGAPNGWLWKFREERTAGAQVPRRQRDEVSIWRHRVLCPNGSRGEIRPLRYGRCCSAIRCEHF